jgi:hypothetical protein
VIRGLGGSSCHQGGVARTEGTRLKGPNDLEPECKVAEGLDWPAQRQPTRGVSHLEGASTGPALGPFLEPWGSIVAALLVVVVVVKVVVVVLAVVVVAVVVAGAGAFSFLGHACSKSNNLNSSKSQGLKLAGPQEREHPWCHVTCSS